MSTTKPQLRPLTGIRFFLALWVLIYHQADPHGMLGGGLAKVPGDFTGWLHTGYVAVTCFYVLSGFILSYNHSLASRWSREQVIRFGRARFARIYPVYILGLVILVPRFLQGLSSHSTYLNRRTATSFALSCALLQSWFPDLAVMWNGPGWSLSNEAFFYACFPFLGIWLWHLAQTRLLLTAAGIWLLSLLIPVALTVGVSDFGSAGAHGFYVLGAPPVDLFWMGFSKFSPLVRLPEFCGGIVLCRAFMRMRESGSYLLGKGYLLYVPAAISIAVLLAEADRLPYLPVHNGLLLPLFGCLILGLACGGGSIATILSTRWIVFLGNASYAMYILHLPLLPWIPFNLWRRLTGFGLGALPRMVVYIVAVVAISSLVYVLIEVPATRALKGRARRAGAAA